VKLGFENKRETTWMVALVVVAVIAAIWSFNSATPAAVPSKTGATKAAGAGPGRPPLNSRRRVAVLRGLKPSLDPSLRFDLLASSEQTEYTGGKRNIFREYVEPVKIPEPVRDVVKTPPVDAGPPPPPPIPLKYYGFANKPGETRKVFLSNGDEVFVAEEGQIIQRRYKVGKITATSVEVEDVLNNTRQTIPLTQG
jgi:hypothetical protein